MKDRLQVAAIALAFLGLFGFFIFQAGVASRYNPSSTHPAQKGETAEATHKEPSAVWDWVTHDAAGFFTAWLVAIGLGQAGLFFWQLLYMRKSMKDAALAANAASEGAAAATEANRINRDNFISDQRPWLGPYGEPLVIEPFRPVPGGYTTAIEIKAINAGRSPAFKVHIVAEMYLMDPKAGTFSVPDRFKSKLASFGTWRWGGLIFPSNTNVRQLSLSLTDEEITANSFVIGEQKTFYPLVWIGITYSSSDGTVYSTHAIYLMRGVFIGMAVPADQVVIGLQHCEAI